MQDDIISRVDDLIKKHGTTDPKEIAKANNISVADLKGTIPGYAAVFGPQPIIGLNVRLSFMWYMLGGWHELAHVFDGHIYEQSFRTGHRDSGFFTADVNSRSISRHERTANLVAAHVFLEDDIVLDITGFSSPILKRYRTIRAQQEKLAHDFEVLQCSIFEGYASNYLKVQLQDTRRKLRSVSDALSDMENEMVHLEFCRSFSDMAAELGVDERILRYKLESMRLRGYDIDVQELEDYSKMFTDVV